MNLPPSPPPPPLSNCHAALAFSPSSLPTCPSSSPQIPHPQGTTLDKSYSTPPHSPRTSLQHIQSERLGPCLHAMREYPSCQYQYHKTLPDPFLESRIGETGSTTPSTEENSLILAPFGIDKSRGCYTLPEPLPVDNFARCWGGH